MATYLVSVHTLRLRLLAQQTAEEEQFSHFETCSNDDLEFEVQSVKHPRAIERQKFDVRSTSCPPITAGHFVPTRKEQ